MISGISGTRLHLKSADLLLQYHSITRNDSQATHNFTISYTTPVYQSSQLEMKRVRAPRCETYTNSGSPIHRAGGDRNQTGSRLLTETSPCYVSV